MPVVAVLANLYDLPINWFLQPEAVLTDVCYRALKKVGVKEKQRFESNAQRWLEGYKKLESELGLTLSDEMINFRKSYKTKGKVMAARLCSELGLGDQPIPSTIDVLHKFGIRVLSLDAEPGIDGFAAKLENESVVVLNSRLSNDRIRLNAAHELGHYLYSDSACSRDLSEKETENRAFEFASNFLLPVAKLKLAFDGYSMLRLIEYKKRYGISLAAMIYRATKEGMLTDRLSKMLWRELNRYRMSV